MATGDRPGPDHLSHFDRLVERPTEHHLFQALRVIEAHYRDAPRLGESRRPREDMVRLGQEAELAFPPSTISAYEPGKAGGRDRMTNRFFGLFGPHGPMPLHITEYVRDRRRNQRDRTLQAFADMVTHRLMGLFYRAWASGQPAVSFDRDADPLGKQVAAISGFRGENLEDRDSMPDLAHRGFAGLLAQGPRNADGLVSILSAFFDVPVTVQEFVGTWLDLEPDDRWELGGPAVLGRSTSIGQRVWSRSAKFRLHIGPLSLEEYERLLPGGQSLERLTSIVRTFVGDSVDWDVNLVLKGDEVPRAALGSNVRLGHVSWTGTRPDPDETRQDADDLYLYPHLGGDPGTGAMT